MFWDSLLSANGRMDAVHYQIVWRNAAGEVIDRIFSHPYWLYPQPFWYHCEVGHPDGEDDSVTLARLSPPAGAATLDVRIGWLRNDSAINADGVAANPGGTLLYVDDLVVDAVPSGSAAAPTIAVSRDGAKITSELSTGALKDQGIVTVKIYSPRVGCGVAGEALTPM